MRDTRIYIVLTVLLMVLSSCSKQEDVCGKILGGYSEWNDYYFNYNYFFRLNTDDRVAVDELTFYSYRVGDHICLDY